jgi:hypothetical protein
VPAGAAHEVGRCQGALASFISWQPGTNFLYYFDSDNRGGGSIIRLDIDSGAKVPLVVIPIRMNQAIIKPLCSPDGKRLAYLLADGIVIRDLASGRESKLARFDPTGADNIQLAWTPDSRTILASISRSTGSQITAFPVDGGPSYLVYTTAMRLGSFAAGKDTLATTNFHTQVNFARPVSTLEAKMDVVETANGISLSPSFAPDGTFAFVSDRSGTNALWIQKPGGAARQLFDGGSERLVGVQFSPDGSRLSVLMENKDTRIVKIMTPDGASLKSFPVPWPGTPIWTPDSKAILVWNVRDLRVWRIDVNDPDKRSPFAPPRWTNVAVRPEGTFAISIGKPGIWRIDGKPSLLTGKYPAFYFPLLAFRGGDVLVPDFTGPVPRLLAQPLSGGADRMLGYLPGGRFNPTELAVNPKTGEILYSAFISGDTNIDLLTLVRH